MLAVHSPGCTGAYESQYSCLLHLRTNSMTMLTTSSWLFHLTTNSVVEMLAISSWLLYLRRNSLDLWQHQVDCSILRTNSLEMLTTSSWLLHLRTNSLEILTTSSWLLHSKTHSQEILTTSSWLLHLRTHSLEILTTSGWLLHSLDIFRLTAEDAWIIRIWKCMNIAICFTLVMSVDSWHIYHVMHHMTV